MAKLQFLQAVFVVWCVVIYNTSEAVKNEVEFKNFIRNKVISKLKPWAEKNEYDQFAVELLMDTDSNWNSFKYLPVDPTKNTNSKSQPQGSLVNYYATLPDRGRHSEQRLLNNLPALFTAYKKNHGGTLKAVVLYTWYLPCSQRDSKKYSSCTNEISDFFTNKKIAKMMQGVHLVVAYTKKNGDFRGCSCNEQTTTNIFKGAGIDLVQVPDNQGGSYFNTVRNWIAGLYDIVIE